MKRKAYLNPLYSHLQQALDNCEEQFKSSEHTLQKNRNETKLVYLSSHEETWVVKSFKVPNLVNRIIYTYFRKSKAERSYSHSLLLGELAPTPIAYIQKLRKTLLQESYYICSHYNYDFVLREVIENEKFPNRKNILKNLAYFTYLLHEKSIFHKDYSWNNILVKNIKSSYEFKVIDLNRMSFGPLSLRKRLRNFSRLCLSDQDLTTVVKEYTKIIGSPHETENIKRAITLKNQFEQRRKCLTAIKNRLRSKH